MAGRTPDGPGAAGAVRPVGDRDHPAGAGPRRRAAGIPHSAAAVRLLAVELDRAGEGGLVTGPGCVMVGYSEGIMAALDQLRPERSVLVVEEPQVIQRRQIEQRLATHPCSVDLVPAPIQGEKHPSRSVAAVPASLMWGSFFPGPSTAWWRPPRWLSLGATKGRTGR